jgi:NADH-quinone oxidoreductase subunit I
MNGAGIIKGMIETARNFAGSYHDKERLTTVQYPEEKLPPVENARTIPFLVYDGDDAMAGLRCTACVICEKECPPQCIYIIKDTVKKPDFIGKMQMQPKVFDIDVSVCMSCGICVEVCPFDAIKMDQVFELSTSDRFGGLLFDKKKLAKPNDYFGKLHKTEASEIDVRRDDEKRKAEAAAAAKAAAAAAKPPATPGDAT